MFSYVPAAFLLTGFLLGVRKDRRRFANAVWLGLTVVALAMALGVTQLRHPESTAAEVVEVLVLLAPALGAVLLAGLLIANGVVMVRKEGRRLGNLLSLLAGLALVAVIALAVAAVLHGDRALHIAAALALLLVCYFSFLFACFAGYAYLYGRLRPRDDCDFVVVLGSGLVGGDRVPPLLAGRLGKGAALWRGMAPPQGRPALMIASGGQGPGEEVAEADAMGDWLVGHGVPADRVLREDRSRSTRENLRFSGALMESVRPGARCVVVTNNFHAFRAAILARTEGVDGQVTGSPTALYYWPSAMIREFAAVLAMRRTPHLAVITALCLLAAAAWLA
ncbi:hypothetical protein BIV57_02370 [Mangrovactinospora gilvigrisea]|uniref:DUF218 domain-containing protein n=1 Tax=Mangrovactinospora gilvigrisea TaxID=1428644 RepID=A0A1J7BKB2_9ACTN|nr:hypothetical protein BIV57_02370 [Mangrovactinospora gilvigrisea]